MHNVNAIRGERVEVKERGQMGEMNPSVPLVILHSNKFFSNIKIKLCNSKFS